MTSRLGALVLSAALGVAAPAAAEIVTFEFVGEVATLTADDGLFGAPGTVTIGDPFSGRFSYEIGAGNLDQDAADPEIGSYALLAFEVDQAVTPIGAPIAVAILHEPGGATLPPAPPDLGRDWLFASAESSLYPSPIRLRLQGPYESAFESDALPADLDLADFPEVAVVQGLVATGIPPNPSIQDVGTITELWRVPEPEAPALGVLALVALGARRRARSENG